MRKRPAAHPPENIQTPPGPQTGPVVNDYAIRSGKVDPRIDEAWLADLVVQAVSQVLRGHVSAQSPLRHLVDTAITPAKPEQLLTDKKLAELFSVTKQTIWRWNKTSEEFPKPLKIEKGSTRWLASEIVAYQTRLADARDEP
ncbi:hypothetical protein AAIH46_13000 [Rhizobium sp. 0TCS1.26]|uniref:helix-turn-helix transcriptional regulator n=1 Tax=Rhizobium sp. 0TCS1.26 TaxID=3142623 RepID=UPI003D26C481